MDMVAVKTPDKDKDMENEGLDLLVDGDYIKADRTSLGGDDGIAVAYALAILDDDSIKHPDIEAIFTVDEEVGMLGAEAMDCSDIKGRIMLNIDSEDEGIFLSSCAGGAVIISKYPAVNTEVTGTEVTINVLILYTRELMPMLFLADFFLNYQSSTTIISRLSQVVRKIIQLPHVQKQLSL
jgi:dipeptidase D